MHISTVNEVAKVMKERSSVRKYKKGVKISEETLREILELTTTAPSSWNLQHWKFILVQEEENKEKLLPITYNQEQVTDSSTTVIVLADTEANKNAERVYDEAVKLGYMSEEAKLRLVDNINRAYETRENIRANDALRNGSLAAMQLMLAAKAYGIDSCPIGGYDPARLRSEFNIPERYIPVMLITLGYADKTAHNTSRFPLEDVIIHESF